jgi:hypothetical protein
MPMKMSLDIKIGLDEDTINALGKVIGDVIAAQNPLPDIILKEVKKAKK